MKKTISIICIVMMLLGMLAGCASAVPEVSVTGLTAESEVYTLGVGETTNLTFNMEAQATMTKDAEPTMFALGMSDVGTFTKPGDADESMSAVYDTLVALVPTYTSENEGIVTVENGIITGVAPGVTNIVVSVNPAGEPLSLNIHVEVIQYAETLDVNVDTLELIFIEDVDTEEEQGETPEEESDPINQASIIAKVQPSNAADKTITFESNDPTVATVDGDGLVVAAGVGECEITITAPGAVEPLTATVNVVVSVPTPAVFQAPEGKENVSATSGKGFQFPLDLGEESPDSFTIVYESSDESIATVSPDGFSSAGMGDHNGEPGGGYY